MAAETLNGRTTLLHEIVARRRGSAFSLCLLYLEASDRLGIPMQPLAAPGPPGHVLLIPKDFAKPSFAVDIFRRGCVFPLMPNLRRMYARQPLDAFCIARRLLHSLRRAYAETNDAVRLCGVLDRLALLDAAEGERTGLEEQRQRYKCRRQLAECILVLRDTSRAPEARSLISSLLADPSVDADARRLETLLADPWLHEFSA